MTREELTGRGWKLVVCVKLSKSGGGGEEEREKKGQATRHTKTIGNHTPAIQEQPNASKVDKVRH